MDREVSQRLDVKKNDPQLHPQTRALLRGAWILPRRRIHRTRLPTQVLLAKIESP
jgi:hypothetical protein